MLSNVIGFNQIEHHKTKTGSQIIPTAHLKIFTTQSRQIAFNFDQTADSTSKLQELDIGPPLTPAVS